MESTGRTFPNRLRRHRKISGLTQREVSKILGVRQSSVSAWENGEVLPNLTNLLKLSILYKALCNDLYFELLKKYQADVERRVIRVKKKQRGT